MGLFDASAIAAADSNAADPFQLSVGRQVLVIQSSGRKELGEDKKPVWEIKFGEPSETSRKNGNMLFWLSGTPEQLTDTNNKIKKFLEQLEIPESDWANVSEDPSLLIGIEANVNVTKSAKGNIFINLVSRYKGEAPATLSSASTSGDGDSSSAYGF